MSSRASTRFTCTKSARASASALPPDRSTADGCSVGISTASMPGPRERELLAAQLRDPLLGLEQQLGREVSERDDHARLDQLELAVEPGRARLDLVGLRVAVARRPALHDVGDVHVGAGQADALDELGEQLARPADERLALQVLLLARAFAHEHQLGVGAPDAEHDLGPAGRELAERAARRGGRDLGERRAGGVCGMRGRVGRVE